MLKQELQLYFDSVYPHSNIDRDQPLTGQIHIRFELGGKHKNGTVKRVDQTTNRAVTLFNDTFDNANNDVWVLIYEYPEPNSYKASNDYLHQQFPIDKFEAFYNHAGEDDVRIIIGKLPVKEINSKNILNAIANTEMGFQPGIDQRIFFFDPFTNKAFQMYDDRGCFVWSDKADKIRDIYIKRNAWIVDYHRPEIDENFK